MPLNLHHFPQDDGGQNPEKRQQMEQLVREELERWDSEASFSQQSGGGRPQSGRASAARSRPGSSASQHPVSGKGRVLMNVFSCGVEYQMVERMRQMC